MSHAGYATQSGHSSLDGKVFLRLHGNSVCRPNVHHTMAAARPSTARKPRLTLKDVAEVLGESRTAVSNAFNRPGELSDALRADILMGFSESPENQAALIGTIQNGMLYSL